MADTIAALALLAAVALVLLISARPRRPSSRGVEPVPRAELDRIAAERAQQPGRES